jgi:hypothetical protein
MDKLIILYLQARLCPQGDKKDGSTDKSISTGSSKRIHPQYQGYRDNCQVYAGGFVDFLMEDGERDLPALESPLTLELAMSTILAVVLGVVLIPYIVDMLT